MTKFKKNELGSSHVPASDARAAQKPRSATKSHTTTQQQQLVLNSNMKFSIVSSLLLLFATATNAVDFLVTSDGTNPTNTVQHFIARILDEAVIEEARAEIGKPDGWKIISGTISKEAVEWNPGWSFHFLPESVFFGELFFEVCDATVDYVEENLDEAGGAFLPNLQWCPWGTRVLGEVSENVPSAAPVAGGSNMPSMIVDVDSNMPSGDVGIMPSGESVGATLMPTEEPTSNAFAMQIGIVWSMVSVVVAFVF